jgi:hypothetical protein
MKRTTGVLIALVCGSSLAIAQGAPDRGGDRGGGFEGGNGGGFSRGGGDGGSPGGGDGGMRGGGGDRSFGGGSERSMERSAPEPRAERAERPEPRAERAEPRAERRERQTAEPREQQEPKKPVRAERNDSDRKEALERRREASDADRGARDKDKSNKDQAEAKDKRDRDGSSAQGRGEGESGRGAEADKRGDTADRATKRDRPPQLASEKRDRVRTVFRDKAHAKRRTGVSINISLGRRLPRDWDFYPVPIEVVEIVPEYRDYVFVYVDDEYVICDPDTYEVVAVIPVGGGPSYAGGGSGRAECSADLALNRDERDLIVELARSEDEVDVDDLEVGWSVPKNIELHEFSGAVLDRADELGACRYFVADDSIAVVDPDESKVVLVIDRS